MHKHTGLAFRRWYFHNVASLLGRGLFRFEHFRPNDLQTPRKFYQVFAFSSRRRNVCATSREFVNFRRGNTPLCFPTSLQRERYFNVTRILICKIIRIFLRRGQIKFIRKIFVEQKQLRIRAW